jgi:formylglycine-generating enzyme required for sulfatase activity
MLRHLRDACPGSGLSSGPHRGNLSGRAIISGLRHPGLVPLFIGMIFLSCTPAPPEGMARIPAGKFVMGTDEVDPEDTALKLGVVKPWFVDEHPAHTVDLPAYFIDRFEVTNGQYGKFVRSTGHPAPSSWNNGTFPAGEERLPVVMVTFDDADAYCRWAGKRLPTEEEWEKAARGTDGRIYPWGNQFDPERANVGGAHPNRLPVGSLPKGASPYGVEDLIGNVWEWTDSWYRPYPGSRYQSPNFERPVRVLRGNSWSPIGHYPPEVQGTLVEHHSTATFRLFAPPDAAIEDVGFRCARSS